jgi:hypothetical protein
MVPSALKGKASEYGLQRMYPEVYSGSADVFAPGQLQRVIDRSALDVDCGEPGRMRRWGEIFSIWLQPSSYDLFP